MRRAIFIFIGCVSLTCLHAQSKNSSLDTLKEGVRTIGNVFKKAAVVTVVVNGIDSADNNLSALAKNVQHSINVKKVEANYAQNITTLKVSYKGKATDLWKNLPANAKQSFIVNSINDSVINLNYRYAKPTAETVNLSGANQQTQVNKATSVKPGADSNTLSKGALLLFKNTKTRMSISQQNKIFDSLGFKISKDAKQFISDDEAADYPFDALVYPADLNKDGDEELVIIYGNSYTSGNTGSSVVVFIADKKGVYKKNLNFPAVLPDVLATSNLGYPDLLVGGPGMEFPVWRWNGREYDYYKEVKDADYEKLKKTSLEDMSKAYVNSINNN